MGLLSYERGRALRLLSIRRVRTAPRPHHSCTLPAGHTGSGDKVKSSLPITARCSGRHGASRVACSLSSALPGSQASGQRPRPALFLPPENEKQRRACPGRPAALSSSPSQRRWGRDRHWKQIIRFEILLNLASLSPFTPAPMPMCGHTHSNQAKPGGMQGPGARLTTADPSVPGPSQSTALIRRALPSASQQLRPRLWVPVPLNSLNVASVSPN